MARKVSIGSRLLDRIEITDGLSASDVVIASGLGFLSDGDTVRIVDEWVSGDTSAQTAPHRTDLRSLRLAPEDRRHGVGRHTRNARCEGESVHALMRHA